MKTTISLLALVSTMSSFAMISSVNYELDCAWQKSPLHEDNFFKPASILLEKSGDTVVLKKDTFLQRKYTPCWIKSFSSCSFSFDYDKKSNWTVTDDSFGTIKVTAPGHYWSAVLEMDFDNDMETVVPGQTIKMMLSGDDGDGVMFSDEEFSCKVLNKSVELN